MQLLFFIWKHVLTGYKTPQWGHFIQSVYVHRLSFSYCASSCLIDHTISEFTNKERARPDWVQIWQLFHLTQYASLFQYAYRTANIISSNEWMPNRLCMEPLCIHYVMNSLDVRIISAVVILYCSVHVMVIIKHSL